MRVAAAKCRQCQRERSLLLHRLTFPFQEKRRASIRQRIDRSDPHVNMFHSVLVINRVQSQDRGLYACHVTSGPTSRSVNTSVHIYGKLVPHRWHMGGSIKQGHFLSAKGHTVTNEDNGVPLVAHQKAVPIVCPLNSILLNWRERVSA